MEPILLQTSEADAGTRLDACLARAIEDLTRSAAAKAVEDGRVLVNGNAPNKSYKLTGHEQIEFTPEEPAPIDAVPQDIPLDVVYEDDDVIVVNKPSGLVVHPAPGHPDGTLVNALLYHCGDSLSGVGGALRPGIVHRLDRDTSGLMLAAKDDDTQRALQNLIRTRTLDRRYITLVHGHIAMDEGTINTGIARSTRDRVKMAVLDDPFARQAITTFKVLERFDSTRFDDGYTLVECHLFTGRTHQIRVHMRHINHACVGDPLYGKCDARADQGLTRQFLHSWRVAFDHPVTGERIECRDELPWDLAAVLDDLAPRSLGRTAAGDEIVPQLGLLEA